MLESKFQNWKIMIPYKFKYYWIDRQWMCQKGCNNWQYNNAILEIKIFDKEKVWSFSNMTIKGAIDDNDILEIKFLDKKINRTIAFVFGGLILIVVIASALSSWSYDVSKGKL